ncbi:MAG TPA: metalloregulator ArsR/SmtB family transcription factor [Solirubrobacteraceae bacterium]|nr:metalloregulator ArsR/SmtB family transcription factor [Solirubrobacteraceae bacterium]
MPDREHLRKRALFDAIATMGRGLASPVRLELLDLLAQGPRSVEELARASGQSTANASQHLQALHAAGLASRRREGTRVRYTLAGEDVLALWLALRDASAARLAQVERAAQDYLGEQVEMIGREELLARLDRGEAVLIDVRPSEEFAAGHIDGARSVPLEEIEQRLDSLPRDTEIVAYCRGRYCAFAHDAVRTLARLGRRARRLEDGWPEWKAAQQPTHAGLTNRSGG